MCRRPLAKYSVLSVATSHVLNGRAGIAILALLLNETSLCNVKVVKITQEHFEQLHIRTSAIARQRLHKMLRQFTAGTLEELLCW